MKSSHSLRTIRFWLAIFMLGLVVSGLTAFPLRSELDWLVSILGAPRLRPMADATHLLGWLARVAFALSVTDRSYPFLAYGTDWLAFAHLVIALAFIGPWRDPLRNRWVIGWGLMACAGVIPLAMLAGAARGIPFAWRLVDCSFGVVGCLPLLRCEQVLARLEPQRPRPERRAFR
jgi:hypothetical protein